MRVNCFTSSYEGVYLKAESSNKNTEYVPGGQVKLNIMTVFNKKQKDEKNKLPLFGRGAGSFQKKGRGLDHGMLTDS